MTTVESGKVALEMLGLGIETSNKVSDCFFSLAFSSTTEKIMFPVDDLAS